MSDSVDNIFGSHDGTGMTAVHIQISLGKYIKVIME